MSNYKRETCQQVCCYLSSCSNHIYSTQSEPFSFQVTTITIFPSTEEILPDSNAEEAWQHHFSFAWAIEASLQLNRKQQSEKDFSQIKFRRRYNPVSKKDRK